MNSDSGGATMVPEEFEEDFKATSGPLDDEPEGRKWNFLARLNLERRDRKKIIQLVLFALAVSTLTAVPGYFALRPQKGISLSV